MGQNMFSSYDNISDDYIPNNMPKGNNRCSNKKPYTKYDADGKECGYYWYYGDTMNLAFTITGEISVYGDSIVYTVKDLQPTSSTVGIVYQKAYNTFDQRSWTCTQITQDQYTWEEDDEFLYPINGQQGVYFSAQDYLQDKKIYVKLSNFRDEEVDSKMFDGQPTFTYIIDKDLQDKLYRGMYYIDVILYEEQSNSYKTIADHIAVDII